MTAAVHAGAHALASAANSRRSTIETSAYLTSANTYTPHTARSHFFIDTPHTHRSHYLVSELVTPSSARPHHNHWHPHTHRSHYLVSELVTPSSARPHHNHWHPDHTPLPSAQSHHRNVVTPQSLRSHLWRLATGSLGSMQTLASHSPGHTLSHHSGSLHSSQYLVPHIHASRGPATPGGLHRLGSLPVDAADMLADAGDGAAAAAAEAAASVGSPGQSLAKSKGKSTGPGDGSWWVRSGPAAADGNSSSPETSSRHAVQEVAGLAAVAPDQQQHGDTQAAPAARQAHSAGAARLAAGDAVSDCGSVSMPGLPLAIRLANPGRFQTLSFRWVWQ
jgi:hypothetical protein